MYIYIYIYIYISSSSLARQPLMGPGLLKKLCLFASVEGDRSGFNFFRFRNNIF